MLTETVNLPKPIGGESQNTSSVRDQLLQGFKASKEYRHAFVEEAVRTSIAAQIKAIREQRGLKQPQFAEELGKSQSWVSRLEDPNQAPPTIPSLLNVAEAFDVDLEIRFRRFSELLHRLDTMTPESFEVPAFEEELKGSLAPQQSVENPTIHSARLHRISRTRSRRNKASAMKKPSRKANVLNNDSQMPNQGIAVAKEVSAISSVGGESVSQARAMETFAQGKSLYATGAAGTRKLGQGSGFPLTILDDIPSGGRQLIGIFGGN